MPFNLILKNIEKYVGLNDAEQKVFTSHLTKKNIKPKNTLIKGGEVCKFSAFVTTGCLRGYTFDKNGTEHVVDFAPPDWWIADMYSLITQKPGFITIEALEDTDVLMLSKKDQEELYFQIPKLERFFRILTEKSLVANQQRLIDNMTLTAEERYKFFCNRYPTLIHTLPQKHIASYIGVTPEFFSRMRTKTLKK
jgi:CRP-like cAMP-binding protein